MTELGRHVPQRPPGDMDKTVAHAQDMLRACNTPDRYKRRRPARAFAQRDPARIPAPPNADGDSDSDEDPPPPLVGQPQIQTSGLLILWVMMDGTQTPPLQKQCLFTVIIPTPP